MRGRWRTTRHGRTTGFALVDGAGHLGGGGLIVIAPLIAHLGVLWAMLVIIGLVLAALMAHFSVAKKDHFRDKARPRGAGSAMHPADARLDPERAFLEVSASRCSDQRYPSESDVCYGHIPFTRDRAKSPNRLQWPQW